MTGASAALSELAAALAQAQTELQNIGADAKGHVGREGAAGRDYKYLTLAKLLEHVRPILAKHDLTIVQTCEPADADVLHLTTTLLHKSGQFISGTAAIPLSNNTPQGYGSSMTYARRYSLAAMIGVAADEDDDGAAGSQGRDKRDSIERDRAFFRLAMADLAHNDVGRKRFFIELREQFGWDHATALEKLGIDSFTKDIPDKTVGEVLGLCQLMHSAETKNG